MSRIAAAVVAVVGLLVAVMSGLAQSAPSPSDPSPSAKPSPPGALKNGEAWAWTQLVNGKSHTTEVRFATTEKPAGHCPTLKYTVGGKMQTAVLRKASDPFVTGGGLQQFPTTFCVAPVPDGARDALIEPTTTVAATVYPGNLQPPLPEWPVNGRPRSIAVIGDAGCEVPSSTVGSTQNQDCQNDWPLEPLSAHAAVQSHPDLVVHVGDYVYREAPEGANDATPGCDSQGQAADWACLIKDFLRPAQAFLAEAPFVFARGNHEDCTPSKVGRGAEWFRYFATVPRKNNECYSLPQVQTEPVQINAGTLHFVLFDSSSASESNQPNQVQAARFAKWFNEVNDLAANHPKHDYFLITHKPLWMVKQASSAGVTWINPTLASAVRQTAKGALADNIDLVLSGHLHMYQMLDFLKSTRPPQLTVGSSGTTLDTPPDDTKVEGKTVDGEIVQHSVSRGVHGYALLRDTGGQWHLTFHGVSGQAWPQDCALSTGPTKEFDCK